MLSGKHVILGVSGGIAAYKSAFLVRELVKAGADVQVVMTRSATEFITPLTLSTLSRRQTIVDMFPPAPDQSSGHWTRHIDLALWADMMLIAPASANTLAKIAHGLADNFLTTLVLALRCPLALAPSMDVDMLRHETTQQNLDLLRQAGCHVIEPEEGELASGLAGPGRLPEVGALLNFMDGILDRVHQDMKGKKVLVTAGPTQEPIDPVRYLGNRSTGRMGFALASAAAQRGAEVTLISGPVQLRTPRNTRRIDVQTAREMQAAVEREFPSTDLLIMAAAVADFAPVHPSDRKLKRGAVDGERLTIECEKNPDILMNAGRHKDRQTVVGFALETEDGLKNAKDKLGLKHLDAIVLNNAGEDGAGFGTETNIVTLLTADGKCEKLPKMTKFDVANKILDRVLPLVR